MDAAETSDPGIIDGKKIAGEVEEHVKQGVEMLQKEYSVAPGLATILVGENPASKMYVKLKQNACERVGIHSVIHELPENTSQEDVIRLIEELNNDDNVHGILVQLPLPEHLNEQDVMQCIHPDKDVDGFNPVNMGRLLIGDEALVPCTPRAIVHLMEKYGVDPQGKNVTIIGHSNVVGKPMAAMMLNRNATVSVCHIYTDDISKSTRDADILIVAAGVKHLIKADMVKEGAIIFDVGINREEGKTYGDVDFKNVLPKASLITPVPGGIGPMTIAMLLMQTLQAAENILGSM